MAVILAHPTAGATQLRRPAAAPRRTRSLLLLGLVPLLLANASWDAVTFLGGTRLGSVGAHAPAPAHPSVSACA